MKKRLSAAALAVSCAIPLFGCGTPAETVARLAPAVVSPETMATMRTWCTRGAPLIAMAQGQNVIPAAREIAETAAPFCAALTAGQVPLTVDTNSPDWLAKQITGLGQSLGLRF